MTIKNHLMIWTLATALSVPVFAKEKKSESEDEGQTIALTSAPVAVQATIAANAASGKTVKVEQETEKGVTTYEAKIKLSDGKELELKIAADGKLLKSKTESEEEDDDKEENDKK